MFGSRNTLLGSCVVALVACVVLGVPAVASAAGWQGAVLNDAIASWWARPNAIYQPYHGITYVTGVSSAGEWVWGAYDHKSGVATRRVLGKASADDHNTPAIYAPIDRPPIVFYTGHNSTNVIRYRISAQVGDWFPGPERQLRMPGKVTYVQVHRGRTPNTLLLLTRCGDDWLLAISNDYGRTWTTRPLVRFDSGSYGYLITTQLADGTIRICAAGHPSHTNLTSVYYAEVDPLGDLRSLDSTPVANVYTGAGLPIRAPGGLSTIYTFPAEKNARLFDVSAAPDPEVLIAEWVGEEQAEYVYLTRDGSTWNTKVLMPTGRPIGFTYSTRYLGGATFPNPTKGGEFYLSREAGGVWSVERWYEQRGRWISKTISQSVGILARPTVPVGASPQLPLLWLRLSSYEHYRRFKGSTYGFMPQGRPRSARSGMAVAGDWDGDGTAEPGVFNAGMWTIRMNGRDRTFRFGKKGDRPIVGDWDGDGADGIGVRRGSQWILSDTVAPARAVRRFRFGRRGDVPLVGDWDGDGVDGIGVRRKSTWYLRNDAWGGRAEMRFRYGRAADTPVVGDWTGRGVDGVGVRRGSLWKLRISPSRGRPQFTYFFGKPSDTPVVGDWGNLGKDSPGVRRGPTGVWYVVDAAPGVPRSMFAPNRFVY